MECYQIDWRLKNKRVSSSPNIILTDTLKPKTFVLYRNIQRRNHRFLICKPPFSTSQTAVFSFIEPSSSSGCTINEQWANNEQTVNLPWKRHNMCCNTLKTSKTVTIVSFEGKGEGKGKETTTTLLLLKE